MGQRFGYLIVAAALLAAAYDTGAQGLLFTTLIAWGVLGLLLIVGIRPATAQPVAGRFLDYPLAALLLLGALSAIRWSVDPGNSDLGLLKLASVLLLALFLPRLFAAPPEYRPLLIWIVALAAAAAGYGFVQLALGWNAMGGRVHGIFLTPNSLAGFLAATLPVCVALMLTAERETARWGFMLLALLQACALAATASRGGWLAAGAGLLPFIFLSSRSSRLLWRPSLKPLAVGLLLLAATLIVLDRSQPELLGPRLASLTHPLTAEPQRYLIWQSAVEMIRERPWTGWGVGAFGVAYTQFKSPAFEGVTQFYAHNDYLQITAELGAAGLAALLWLIGAAAWAALGARRETMARGDASGALLSAAVVGGAGAVLLHSLVDFDLYVPVIGLVLAVYLGYLRSWLPRKPVESDGAEAAEGWVLPAQVRPLVSAVCCLVLAVLVTRPFLADRADRAGRELMGQGRYEQAADRFLSAAQRHPSKADYYGRLGFAYERWANETRRTDLLLKAEEAFRAATVVGPYKYYLYWDLGRFYVNYKNFSSSFKEFDPWGAYRRAAELHPTKPAIRQELERLEITHPDKPKSSEFRSPPA